MDTEATADGGFGTASRPIGQVLGAARTARGLDLAEIARDTRVPVRHLAAIEADDHDHLPALPYAIGFVKAFARAVGIDPEMAGAHFRAETSKVAHVPVAPAMVPVDERRLPPRGLVTASVAALLAVVALIVAWSAGAFDPAPPAAPVQIAATKPARVAPPPTAIAPTPAMTDGGITTAPDATTSPGVAALPTGPAASPTVPPAPATRAAAPPATATAAATVPTAGVVITASEDAWFKISVYDPAVAKVVTVKTGVLAKGERYSPPPTPGLRLWTGRAGALAITVDGRAVPPLGGPVETVRNVSLDPADLRARLAAPGPLPGRAGPPVG